MQDSRHRTVQMRARPGAFKEMFDVRDINYEGIDGMKRTKRCVDPQAPKYVIHNEVIADEPMRASTRRLSGSPKGTAIAPK